MLQGELAHQLFSQALLDEINRREDRVAGQLTVATRANGTAYEVMNVAGPGFHHGVPSSQRSGIQAEDAHVHGDGPAGDLVYFAKMDNTQYASVTISQHKARAAATFRRPTKVFEENLGKGPEFIYQLTLDGMIGSQGGVPLVVGGKLIGAIGCSGGLGPQDLQVCTAGVNALK